MTRSKRPLSETDGNAAQPARKLPLQAAVANVRSNIQLRVVTISSSEDEDTEDEIEVLSIGSEEDESSGAGEDSEESSEEHDDAASISSMLLPGEKIEDYKETPFEYIRIFRPFWDYKEENAKSNKPVESGKLYRRFRKDIRGFKYNRRAVLKPEHKWVMMRGSWQLLQERLNEAEKRCPHNFNMCIYNDFWGYGLVEVIENFLSQYSTAFNRTIGRKRSPEIIDKSHNEMWMVVSAFGQFLNMATMFPFGMIDDAQRFSEIVDLMARTILSALNSLHRAGHLTTDSEYKDIGFVIGTWYTALEQFQDLASLEIHRHVLGYAKKAEVDVMTVFGTREAIEAYDDELPKNPGLDTRKFAKHFKHYKDEYGQSRTFFARPIYLGGDYHDITKWPSTERAKYAFDKKDPIRDVPEN